MNKMTIDDKLSESPLEEKREITWEERRRDSESYLDQVQERNPDMLLDHNSRGVCASVGRALLQIANEVYLISMENKSRKGELKGHSYSLLVKEPNLEVLPNGVHAYQPDIIFGCYDKLGDPRSEPAKSIEYYSNQLIKRILGTDRVLKPHSKGADVRYDRGEQKMRAYKLK